MVILKYSAVLQKIQTVATAGHYKCFVMGILIVVVEKVRHFKISLLFLKLDLHIYNNTIMLIISDCFSKTAHFVPLSKLPTTFKIAQLKVQHMF